MGEFPDNVEQILQRYRVERLSMVEGRIQQFRKILRRCESPAEQLALIALVEVLEMQSGYEIPAYILRDQQPPQEPLDFSGRPSTYVAGMSFVQEDDDPDGAQLHCLVIPQEEVTIDEQTFRLDFLIELTRVWPGSNGGYRTVARYAIEIDGHDYHERTKEQARKDRQRERKLMRGGFTVIRFTAQEVWQDAMAVAQEIIAGAVFPHQKFIYPGESQARAIIE